MSTRAQRKHVDRREELLKVMCLVFCVGVLKRRSSSQKKPYRDVRNPFICVSRLNTAPGSRGRLTRPRSGQDWMSDPVPVYTWYLLAEGGVGSEESRICA